MFINFIQPVLDTFEIKTAIAIPEIPPDELEIMSVISLAPIANINCTISNIRLVQIIGMNCFGNDFSSHKT